MRLETNLFLMLALTAVATATTLRKRSNENNTRRLEKIQKRRSLVQQSLVSNFPKLPGANPWLSQKGANQADHASRILEDNQGQRTVIVECAETSLFRCPTCGGKIQAQQDRVMLAIQSLHPTATLVSSSQRLVNAIYVQLPDVKDDDTDASILKIDGVVRVTPHGNLEMEIFPAVEYIGGFRAREQFCATGRDVKVAVLDSGIDYTHFMLGGPGTQEAYEAAYGGSPYSFENQQRDGLFPTLVVVDGYDFVGEFTTPFPDDDPIDSFGHGTAVSEAILTVAPNAKLVAVKVRGHNLTWAFLYSLDSSCSGSHCSWLLLCY
jgi:hypothetical protein